MIPLSRLTPPPYCTCPVQNKIRWEVIVRFADFGGIADHHRLGTDHLTWKGGGGLWFFASFRIFRTTRWLEYLFFLLRKARNIFPEFNIRFYDKNSESDYFFFFHQNHNIFFCNIGNHNIFLEKTSSPLQVKWSFP